MTEQTLIQAAQALPNPETEYEAIVHTAKLRTSPKPSPLRRKQAVALILALLLLGGCAAGAAAYSFTAGYSSYHFSDARRISARLDVQVPEQLGRSPFYELSTTHTTDRNTPWYLGSLFSLYQTTTLRYGTKGVEWINADGEPVYGLADRVELEFGSTENKLWRRIFPLTDEGIWCPGDLKQDTYTSETYQGILLQGGTRCPSYGNHNSVIWHDEELAVCFTLTSRVYSTEDLFSCAKELIDRNHPD